MDTHDNLCFHSQSVHVMVFNAALYCLLTLAPQCSTFHYQPCAKTLGSYCPQTACGCRLNRYTNMQVCSQASPDFVLQFAFSMILRSERAMKIRKAWNNYLVNDIRWMRSGCRGVLNYKYVHNKTEREFHTGEAEYSRSCECLGSCLVTECSKMKSSMLLHVFEYGPLPRSVHVVST